MMKAAGVPLSQNHDPDHAKPGNKPGLDLLDKDEVKPKRPSMWNIVFYNDDYTPMEFVEFVLMTVFHIPKLDALALTLVIHTKGRGIAWNLYLRDCRTKAVRRHIAGKDRGASITG